MKDLTPAVIANKPNIIGVYIMARIRYVLLQVCNTNRLDSAVVIVAVRWYRTRSAVIGVETAGISKVV
jgi:hypothetical protein